MSRTSSKAPLVLGIVGGVLGIIGGACATCAISDITGATYNLGSWLVLIGSILGLVGGCCAKSQKWGSLLELIAGIVVAVGSFISCTLLLVFPLAGFILLIVGGAVGMKKKA